VRLLKSTPRCTAMPLSSARESVAFTRVFFALSCVIFLSSCLIYLLIRPANTLMFSWAKTLGLTDFIHSLRSSLGIRSESISLSVIYSLPDAAWVLFGSCCMAMIWRSGGLLWRYLFPSLAIALELLQFPHLVPGTFDFLDLLYLVAAAVVTPLLKGSVPDGAITE
jgi:hypothetical protein